LQPEKEIMKETIKLVIAICFIISSSKLMAQSGSISGNIKTSDGKPAGGVSISLKEIKRTIASADDGSYTLGNLKEGKYTVIVSFVGLQTQEKPVLVNGSQANNMDFTLFENASQLDEVIITVSRSMNERPASVGKVAIKPMDLPQSIAVIGKDVLERQQTLRLSEALMNVNGIYIQSTTGGGQEELAGRGYAYNSSNTFKNGARFNNGAMPEMSALEKVEVMKGSAAILMGNVAAGGVINLVTKKPKFERGGEISFRTGSYAFYKPSIDFYGSLNKGKTIAYRINSSYENSGSYRDNVKAERFYINPSFIFKLGKKTTLLLEGDYLNDDRTSDFGTGAINYTIADIPRDRFLGATWGYYKTQQSTVTATTTHHINQNWEIRNVSSYQNYNSDLFGTTRPNSGNFIQPDGMWVRGLQRSGIKENYFITQFDLTGQFKTGGIQHTLLVGADADKYNTDATAYVYANKGLANKNIYDTINIFDLNKYKQREDIPEITPTTLTHTPTRRYGIYIQDLISVTKNIKLLAGVRYSYQETSGAYIDSLGKNKRTLTASSDADAFTPRFGIVYQPIKTISIFTSYSNSFTLNTGTDVYLQPLAPSYINQFEAGIKTELFQKNLSFNVTAYQIVNSNLAQTSLTDINGNPNNNSNIKELAGEVTSKGVEIDIATKSIYGVSFMGGYSFNETKYTKSNTYIEGSKLRYNPQHTANASVYYSFGNRTAFKGLNAGFIAYYVGDRVAGRSTRVQVNNDSYKLMPIPDYVQFDATVGYSIQKITLRFKLSNLFNKLSYYVHDDNSVNPIAPRQFAATVSLKL
jgi:iron complex outermembrane receptor protein